MKKIIPVFVGLTIGYGALCFEAGRISATTSKFRLEENREISYLVEKKSGAKLPIDEETMQLGDPLYRLEALKKSYLKRGEKNEREPDF